MIRRPVVFLLASVAFLTPSGGFIAKSVKGKVQMSGFGKTEDGQAVYQYVFSNKSGVQVAISLQVPDRKSRTADIVLGYDSIVGY